MTTLDLDAIQARADAAEPGPWKAEDLEAGFGHRNVFWVSTDRPHVSKTVAATENGVTDCIEVMWSMKDATFIAHARTDIPALIAEVKALRGKVAEVERLARLDLKCPCCTGYGNILAALQSDAPTTGEPDA